jgi:hypothetical protein
MSKFSYKRLGVALMGLAVPFMFAAPVGAQVPAVEVGNVAVTCLDYASISDCTHGVAEGLIDVAEDMVNEDLAAQGVAYTVDAGDPEGAEPGELGYDINDIAINPLPPLIPVPAVPGVPYQ